MYTITHYQGYDMPLDIELLENYEGEAKDIILQSFIDEGMFTSTVYTVDDVTEEDIELDVSEFLSKEEIAALKDIEENASDSFWDGLTVETLREAIKPTNYEEEAA